MQRVLIVGSREPSAGLLLPGVESPSRSARQQLRRELSKTSDGWYTVVRPCASVSDLIKIVEGVARVRKIDVLDILDHGAGGGIMLGDGLLFLLKDGKLTGADTARQLASSLSETAQVRLLGCETALESQAGSGQALLLALAHVLGKNRIVFGTLGRVRPSKHFHPDKGFLLVQELLYSSLQAIDHPAPTMKDRHDAIIAHSALLRSIERSRSKGSPAPSRTRTPGGRER